MLYLCIDSPEQTSKQGVESLVCCYILCEMGIADKELLSLLQKLKSFIKIVIFVSVRATRGLVLKIHVQILLTELCERGGKDTY